LTIPNVCPIITTSRTRDKSEELLWKQNAKHHPAVPEIIATKTRRAKSKRIDVTKSKNKHDVDTILNSKSKRIATQVTF
jgi:hypothetical protein